MTAPTVTDAQMDAWRAEMEAEHERDRLDTAARHWQGATPLRFRDAHLDQLDSAVREAADRWLADVADHQAGNLVLGGPVGVGKTHAALAIGREYHLRFHPSGVLDPTVVFRPVSKLLDELRPDGGGQLRDYTRPALLILDDLGTEKATEWVDERLYVIVNQRWLACQPTIVTTNLTPDELDATLGTRTWDRLRDGARAVALAGSTRRRPA